MHRYNILDDNDWMLITS